MDERTPADLKLARRTALMFDLVFWGAALLMVADVYYLDKATVPATIPLYGFVLLFAVIMLTYPIKQYVMTRWMKRWIEGTEEDSPGGHPISNRIFKWKRETDEERLCKRLAVAAGMLAAAEGSMFSRYES